jgi:hypothetical protein
LGIDGGLHSLGSSRKDRLEPIAYQLVSISIIGFYGVAENIFLTGEGKLHGRWVSFPVFGTLFYICEQESHGAGWPYAGRRCAGW